MRHFVCFALVVLVSGCASARAETPKSSTANPPPQTAASADDLYKLGQQLFETYAPAEVKAEYEFISKEQWDTLATEIQTALQSDSLEGLAQYAPQGRAGLLALRTLGTDNELADWLEQRLDEIEGAEQAGTPPSTQIPPAPAPAPTPPKPEPKTPSRKPAPPSIPHYDLWLGRVRDRPAPERAAELMPKLRQAFAAEGVPTALAWLAEAESSFNPNARSPVGAKGLFQLMPETARGLGLDTFMPDERTHPEKSARAAARYLRQLHAKFGDWPLALAAYNAGEGRVSRALAKRKAKDFAAIADALPAETRMYVPKIAAIVAVRTGTPLTSL